MAGYGKLNESVFGERDFQEHLLLMLERELSVVVVVVVNKCWDILKSTIRPFAAY